MWAKTSQYNSDVKKAQEERDAAQASLQFATDALFALTSKHDLLQKEFCRSKLASRLGI